MSKYIIKVQPAECNPDFAPDKQLENGIETDGFLMMTMKDEKPHAVIISGMTIDAIARMLAGDETEAGSAIWQAIAIAEGLKRACEIGREYSKKTMARGIAELLRKD